MGGWPQDKQSREKRFWAKVDKGGECWEWIGCLDSKGYGQCGDGKGKQISTHRLSWQFAFGDVPAGISVLHKCDNPSCVNPEHLFLGAHTDNMQDMMQKG